MKAAAWQNFSSRPMFVAGHRVPEGSYINIETGRIIYVRQGEILPASLDGHVAAYVARPQTWADISDRNEHRES